MLCSALPPSSLLRQADPRCFSAPPSQLEITPPPILPRFPRGERQAGKYPRACVRVASVAGEARRRLEITPLPSPLAAHALAQCGASRRPVVCRRGRRVKSRRRARAGNPEGEWRGTAAQGVARPSVLPIRERFNTTAPRGRDYCHRRTSHQQLFPHSAWGLGFPSCSPRLAPRRPGAPDRAGSGASSPRRAPPGSPSRDAAGPECRAMGNGTKAAADVREGRLKLMDQCLAATSLAVVHTALRYGLANLT
ncbi:hypothetical protein ACQJBY_033902 [Aegilops geniculata]